MSREAIDYFSLSHPLRGPASKIALGVRKKIFQVFMDTMKPDEQTTILDVGVTPDRTLPESNFFEKLYPYKHRLTATSIEDASFLEQEYPGLTFIRTPEGELPFEDQHFDMVFCSAVLEHVGDRKEQGDFVRELLRVAKMFFLSTPNWGFPVEFHTFLPFIHWLPQPLHQAILRRLGLEFWAETKNLNLLSSATIRTLFPEHADIQLRKHYLLGMPSNLMVYGEVDRAPVPGQSHVL
ncbi:MAG: methyltransferase domain-containing protein [Desulfobulbaceae bacterium]|nr:methyltransferase domain-containing protein [Desulfobulbaceae bacterium]